MNLQFKLILKGRSFHKISEIDADTKI